RPMGKIDEPEGNPGTFRGYGTAGRLGAGTRWPDRIGARLCRSGRQAAAVEWRAGPAGDRLPDQQEARPLPRPEAPRQPSARKCSGGALELNEPAQLLLPRLLE